MKAGVYYNVGLQPNIMNTIGKEAGTDTSKAYESVNLIRIELQ